MTQRIHTALLELHLGCALSSGQLEGPSSGQLMLAAKAAADTPAIAAAAAAAGFLGSAATEAKLQQEQELMLQLPKPVIDKLLSLDAGDLDLMIKYPTALQAQVSRLQVNPTIMVLCPACFVAGGVLGVSHLVSSLQG